MPNLYFKNVISVQFGEIEDHHDAGEEDQIDKEIVDIMSICLNWLRSRGHDDEGVRACILARAPRFADPYQIIEDYNVKYGL